MPGKFGDKAEGNRRYQRRLAALLMKCEGRAEALETCRDHGWEGVLAALMNLRPATPYDGSPLPPPGE